MNLPASNDYQGLYRRLQSPLAAFYQRERELANDTCFVQPIGNDELIEFTWAEAGQQIRSMAAYLRSLDLTPGSNIALLSTNTAYWIMADLAIWMAGHRSVPLFPVLTANSIQQIMEHSEASVLFVGKLLGWDDMQVGVPENTTLISMPLAPLAACEQSIRWEDIVTTTPALSESPDVNMEDVATIIYTSGTTGMPKGVMHSFRNMAAVGTLAGEMYEVSDKDRKLSYLPLAHVAERAAVEINQLYYGYTVFFTHSLATFADDLRRARPTIFFAVPRIWMKLQHRVLEKVDAAQLQQLLEDEPTAESTRSALLGALGLDALRIGISGAAPLSTSLIDWFKALGINILEGYAMSENFAYGYTTRAGEAKTGYVGTPCPYVDSRLSEQGEVLLKSPATMMGYFKEPKLSMDAFDQDGYLRTGDKGEIDSEGRLKITGRIKEIFKTSKGKFVAPAPIEDKLLRNLSLEHACVVGSGLPRPLGLLVLSEIGQERLEADGAHALKESLKETLDEINQAIDKHENLSHLVVVNSDWDIASGLVTPTLKIKRAVLENRYTQRIEQWSREKDTIIVE